MKKQTKMEYETPFIVVHEVAFEGDLCQSNIKGNITVTDLEQDDDTNPNNQFEF